MQKKLRLLFLVLLLFSHHSYCQNFTYANVVLKSATFSSGNLSIRRDDGTGTYGTPQWSSTYSKQYPIAYVSGNSPRVSAVLTITCAIVPSTVLIRGHGSDSIEFASATVTVAASGTSTHNMTYPATTGSKVFTAGTVGYFNPFTINWEISFDSGVTWKSIGATYNTLYVTKSAPLSDSGPGTVAYKYHTVYELSCKNANGKSTEANIIADSWSEFLDHVVLNENGDSLFYYKDMSTLNVTLASLMKYRDAECFTFAQLFLAMLKVQGISRTGNYINFSPNGNTACDDSFNINRFLVKNWTFGTPTASGTCPDFPYKNVYNVLVPYPYNSYDFTSADVTDNSGAAGMCTSNPSSFFNNHQICYVDGVYYDPCYGLTYPSIASIKNIALTAWGFRTTGLTPTTAYFSPDMTKSDLVYTVSTW